MNPQILAILVRVVIFTLDFLIFFTLGMQCAKLDVLLTLGKPKKIQVLFHLVTWPVILLASYIYHVQVYRILDHYFPL